MTKIETTVIDHGDPADWDEWPDGYGAVIARFLEDEGWHVDTHDDTTVVNVIAADGRETGVWHNSGGKTWTGISVDGCCNKPVRLNVDVTDPEAIAQGADREMRRLGLKPGKPAQLPDEAAVKAWEAEGGQS